MVPYNCDEDFAETFDDLVAQGFSETMAANLARTAVAITITKRRAAGLPVEHTDLSSLSADIQS